MRLISTSFILTQFSTNFVSGRPSSQGETVEDNQQLHNLRQRGHRRIQTSIICDRFEESTCYLSSYKSWSGDTIISPTRLSDENGDLVDDVQVLVISPEATLTCTTNNADDPFCQITIQDFRRITVAGTIIAPDVYLTGDNIFLDGTIDGNGLGYPPGQGPSPAKFYRDDASYMGQPCIRAGGIHYANMGVSGASHGGVGGNSDCIGDNFKGIETEPSYGNIDSPREFGSGGVGNCGAADTSAGGGRVYIEAFEEITINGNMHEDAAPCVSTGGDTSAALCGTGSGGSVWIKAPTITGQGSISAQAGNYLIEGGYLWATGGGGRIALHGNTISPLLQQNIDVAVDIESTNFICVNGDSGSVELGCYTTLCHNGGTLSPNGDCSCDCPEPDRFGGPDCSQCQITHCSHGGELDPVDCKCLCQEGFTGDRCDQCDPDFFCNGAGACNNVDLSCTCNEGYYGERCDTFCDPIQSCNGLGVCNDDGICECRDGKYGGDCSCDIIQDCQSNPENACRSNGGYCKDDGSCECQPGWTGCHCDIQCSSVLHCSDHGSCNFDGTCHCDKGWEGESCSEQDLDQFCNGNDRISDYPCLKGVVDTLGYGVRKRLHRHV